MNIKELAAHRKYVAVLTKRVERGVKFLDKHFGRGVWLAKINLSRLDLGDGYTCMLGQTFKDNFDGGMLALAEGEGDSNPSKYGFDVDMNVDNDQKEYDLLGVVWTGKIKKYRKALEATSVKKALRVVKKAESVI